MGRAGSKQTHWLLLQEGRKYVPGKDRGPGGQRDGGGGRRKEGALGTSTLRRMLSELCCETHTLCGALLSSTHLSPTSYGGRATSLGWGSIQGKDRAPAFRLRLLVHLITLSAVFPNPAPPCHVPWDIGFSSPLAETRLYQQPEIRLAASEASIKCSKYVTSTF